jgi:hypothetical protein
MASSSHYDPEIDEEENLFFTSEDEFDDEVDIDDAVSVAAQLSSEDEDSNAHNGRFASIVKVKLLQKENRFYSDSVVATTASHLPEFQPSLEM